MFISEAHSVTQQSRLAITLAWIAGYTNAVTLLTCHTATSHLSGATASLGIEIVEQEWALAGFSAFLIITFVFGAALSAVATELGRLRNWESIYVAPIALQGMLLTAFALCIEFVPAESLRGDWKLVALGCAAMAMGLQNATITRISRGVVRTTHVTGVLTDLGHDSVLFLLARLSRTAKINARLDPEAHISGGRLLLLLTIVGSFAFGAALGTISYEAFPQYSMFPPVLFLCWIIFQDLHKPIAEIVEVVPSLEAPAHQSLPSGAALYRMHPDKDRLGKKQRLPNLALWVAKLPQEQRAILLDISEFGEIDSILRAELRSLSAGLHAQGRALFFVERNTVSTNSPAPAPFFGSIEEAIGNLRV